MPTGIDTDTLFTRLREDRRLDLPLAVLRKELIEADRLGTADVRKLFDRGAIYFINPERAATEFGSDSWQAVAENCRYWNRLLHELLVRRIDYRGVDTVIAISIHLLPTKPHDEMVEYQRRHLEAAHRGIVQSTDWR